MKLCTTVIERLTHANGDFQCEENFNESAFLQSSDIAHRLFVAVA